MRIVFLSAAEKELDEAFAWYEEQAVGLGGSFLSEIDKALRLIATYPKLQSPVTDNLRRCLVNRFPYGIYYGFRSETIVVVAIAHLRRKPSFWSHRE